MRSLPVACTKCKAPVPLEICNIGDFRACPACGASLQVHVFPALTRLIAPTVAESVLIEGESSCFYHPQKKAVIACESCGRFLCALCDIEIGGEHRCPACLESGKRKKKLHTLENQRTLYDGIALMLATVPILFFPLPVVTAPAAMYYVIRYWNAPTSVLPRTKVRFVIAFILALAQVVGAALLIYLIFFHHGSGR